MMFLYTSPGSYKAYLNLLNALSLIIIKTDGLQCSI